MRRRYAAGILSVFALAVLTASADDFWVKKDWKQWTTADCKKLLEDSPWTHRKLLENETNVGRLPSAGNAGVGAAPGQADTAQNKDTGEVNYVVQIRSAAPIHEALIRQAQIDKQYDKMSDADKKAFDAQMDALYKVNDDTIVVHVRYYANRDSLGSDLEKSWKSLPADTVPADMALISSNGSKVTPLTFVPDRDGKDEFDMTFPKKAFAEGLKSFKLQIPHPALGDFGAQKVMVEFKLDKMTFDGKPAF
jgi:hypothetical protein